MLWRCRGECLLLWLCLAHSASSGSMRELQASDSRQDQTSDPGTDRQHCRNGDSGTSLLQVGSKKQKTPMDVFAEDADERVGKDLSSLSSNEHRNNVDPKLLIQDPNGAHAKLRFRSPDDAHRDADEAIVGANHSKGSANTANTKLYKLGSGTHVLYLLQSAGNRIQLNLTTAAGLASSSVFIGVGATVALIVLSLYVCVQFSNRGPAKNLERESLDEPVMSQASPQPVAARPRKSAQGNSVGHFFPQSQRVATSQTQPPPITQVLRVPNNAHLAVDALATPMSTDASLKPMPSGSVADASWHAPTTSSLTPAIQSTEALLKPLPSSSATNAKWHSAASSSQRPPDQIQTQPAPQVLTKGLCPGLVVPADSECVLAVQALAQLDKNGGTMSPSILDLAGKPVLLIEIAYPWPKDTTSFKQRAPLFTLFTTSRQGLAFCRAGGEGGGRRSMYIYDKDDVLFGCIKRDVTRPRYVLTSSRGGLNLLFEGDFQQHTVNVLSDNRQLLSRSVPTQSKADPRSAFYQVRIVANVDVGLIVSGLIAIDAIESL